MVFPTRVGVNPPPLPPQGGCGVFPTRVGVNRGMGGQSGTGGSFPHTRGGEPQVRH